VFQLLQAWRFRFKIEMSAKAQVQKQQTPAPVVKAEFNGHETKSGPVQNGGSESLPIIADGKIVSPKLGLSRLNEKNILVGLNNRLAAVIEKNKQLENTNSTLTRRIETVEEDKRVVLTRLETTFDKERGDYRKQLEDAEKENKKLALEEAKTKSELDDLKQKLDKNDKDLKDTQKKLADSDKEKDAVAAKLKKEAQDNEKLKKDKQNLENENAKKDKDIDDLRKTLEKEALEKIELENQLKNKVQEFTVKAQRIEQEVRDFKSRREVEIQEMDGRLQNDYETKLQQVLEELRAEYEKQLQANKEVQLNLFNRKEEDLKAQLTRLSEEIETKIKDLKANGKKIDDLSNKVAALEGDKHGLETSNEVLKKKLKSEKDRLQKEKKQKEEENQVLQADKDKLMTDYADLMETKVTLDNEIATYRAMLEGEEERLNLSSDVNSNEVTTENTNNDSKSKVKLPK